MNTQVENKVIVSAALAREVRAELERRAVAGDRTLSQEVRKALVRYVRSEGEEEADAA